MVREFARAKINLTLDILGTRADGFHEVEMIMQALELADALTLEKISRGVELTVTGGENIPTDEKNLAHRAAVEVSKALGKNLGVSISLAKKIPAAAGLGGGSSDAAAVIRGINRLYALNLSVKEMCEIGARVGSDVPFCVTGGTCLAKGRGEILTRLKPLKTFSVILIKPRGEISTAWAYKTYDEKPATVHPPTAEIIQLLDAENYSAAFPKFANVLEPVATEKIPAIATYRKFLQDCGVEVALMSGSGPTVFALADAVTAEKVAANFSGDAQIFITKTRID
ncbi:MAG: 4-(cytidine 5'-diphospho)-2-C-methyl-D-erythritol kinase [Selenomonadaceae bacterium]|nr:4-(cytidine 5'-diphospho)-2-C-methyl-D-erythritol kinase [Selenomonadaceae bacterium]